MHSSNPLVSVIIPCFNSEKFIGETLDSILGQSYENFEILVVNDGSTDGSLNVLNGFRDRIKIINQKNVGVSSARNHGILRSKGELIAFCDSDDIWHKSKLEVQVNPLLEDPRTGMVFNQRKPFHNLDEIDLTTKSECKFDQKDFFYELLEHNKVDCSSVLVRKLLLAKSGLFDTTQVGAEDTDLWLRLHQHTTFCEVSPPLSYIRKHGDNVTSSYKFRENRAFTQQMMYARWFSDSAARKILAKHIQGNFWALAYESSDLGDNNKAFRYFLNSFLFGKRDVKSVAKVIQYYFKK